MRDIVSPDAWPQRAHGFQLVGVLVGFMGAFFTGRVQIREGHTLIRTGLYSRLRHPAYAGSLLACFGLGLAFSNWWTLACSVLPYLVAIGYRIRVEEAVLQETFGPTYAQYARTTALRSLGVLRQGSAR